MLSEHLCLLKSGAVMADGRVCCSPDVETGDSVAPRAAARAARPHCGSVLRPSAVKPQIYEKAVSSLPDLTLHPLGSRQSLTCTVHGVPQPVIEWFWQPCDHSHPKAR